MIDRDGGRDDGYPDYRQTMAEKQAERRLAKLQLERQKDQAAEDVWDR